MADIMSRKRTRDVDDIGGPSRRPTPALSSKDLTTEQYRKTMYLAYVQDTLRKKSQGKLKAYEELVTRFSSSTALKDSTSTQELGLLMAALSHVVSQLDRQHSLLVEAVLNLPWITASASFAKLYISFIGMLVSARPEYNALVLERAVDGLTHQSGLRALNHGGAEPSATPLTRREVYERQHILLQHVLSLVPTLANTLQPFLQRKLPHKRLEKIAQVTYVRNLLRLSEYCNELSDRILTMIVDHAIQIDVEIQVEIEELEAEENEDGDPVFDLDPFDAVIGDDPSEAGDSDGPDEGEEDDLSDLSSEGGEFDDESPALASDMNMAHIQDMVSKLDAILKLVFEHFDKSSSPSSLDQPSPPTSPHYIESPEQQWPPPLTPEQTRSLRRSQFYTLLSIFDRTILRTFKSRYTQFLLFWFSSLDPEFTDNFLGTLLNKALMEVDQPSVTRAAAASYVASFVSRAQFVDADSARRVVSLLCAFLGRELDTFAESDGPTHLAQYTVFYAVTQAVFLIFCFRWRDLHEENDDSDAEDGFFGVVESAGPKKKWISDLDVIHRVVTSALNPLRVCSVNVVKQFARVAQTTGFIYCYSILESNRRNEYGAQPVTPLTNSPPTLSRSISGLPIASAAKDNLLLQAHNAQLKANPLVLRDSTIDADLNSFFPFDPYRLPLSHSYIEGVYREWSSVAIDEDENDEDDENDHDGDEPAVASEDEGGALAISFRKPSPTVMSMGRSGTAPSGVDDDDLGLGKSFAEMSVSPAKHMSAYIALQV